MSTPADAEVGAQSDSHDQAEAAQQASVEITRSIDAPVERVWQLLITPTGSQALLGAGAALGGKGEPWHSEDGSSGVVRSYHPMEQLRVSWHANPDAPPTVVELDLSPAGSGTELTLRQDRIGAADAPHLRQRWTGALDRLAEAAAG